MSAPFYSIVESARLAAVELRADLREATPRAIGNQGAVILARALKSSESREKTAG